MRRPLFLRADKIPPKFVRLMIIPNPNKSHKIKRMKWFSAKNYRRRHLLEWTKILYSHNSMAPQYARGERPYLKVYGKEDLSSYRCFKHFCFLQLSAPAFLHSSISGSTCWKEGIAFNTCQLIDSGNWLMEMRMMTRIWMANQLMVMMTIYWTRIFSKDGVFQYWNLSQGCLISCWDEWF